MRTQVIQKAIVLNSDGEMLMVRRSDTDVRRPLQWDLPGGLHEKGEELLASVEREITEETGLKVSGIRPIYSKTEVRTWKNHDEERTENAVFIFYTASTKDNDVALSFEHDKYQWMLIDEAVKEYEYPLHREVLQHLIDNQILVTS